MNKSLLIGAVSTIALSACANMGPNMTSDGQMGTLATPIDELCNTPDFVHCINVVIQDNQIYKIEDTIVKYQNHIIIWRINPTSGYTFADDGIDFKSNATPRPDNEFLCKLAARKRIFFCIDRNTRQAVYDYKVTVKDANGTPLPVLDPKIFNN